MTLTLLEGSPEGLERTLGPGSPRIVESSTALDTSDLFDLLERVLALPDYFGRNWDALDECLAELDPATLLFRDAERLLEEEPGDRRILLRVLAEHSHLHTILQGRPGSLATWGDLCRLERIPFILG